ncbi:heme oxygenase (biliverdin-producing) [Stigmatella erecta]|uniref:Heme oxygenase n=1 Tax=Stigmatella erecta TaxID=83460 RepID=A0A1H9ZJ22_9BACT|nr:biliverdin-producing heme oxygenase [Stigmatella erecta]SES81660.1 heme oxygenase [Stigmatella erecta]
MSATALLRIPTAFTSGAETPSAPVREAEPPRLPLSKRLEEGTAAPRREAEQTLFMKGLFRGAWGTGVYGQFVRGRHYITYLQCLLEVYEALEEALESQRTHAAVGGFVFPELWRSHAIQEDLTCFLGEDWRDTPRPLHLTTPHVTRIQELVEEAPHLLVAHAYVRYTRDILSGPMLGNMVSRAFDLTDGEGIALYQSVGPSSLEIFQRRVSRNMDALNLSDDQMREVVQEARLAFRLEIQLSDALSRGALGLRSPDLGR